MQDMTDTTADNLNLIHLVLGCDDRFAPFVATTVRSIVEHTNNQILVSVISDGITNLSKEKILQSIPKDNLIIEFIDIDGDNIFDGFQASADTTRATYCRFLIPKLWPNEDKIIYSDVDVIFTDNIAKLYNEDLSSYVIAAMSDPFTYTHDAIPAVYKKLGIASNHKYFNAGVLLINCREWNRQTISEKKKSQKQRNSIEVI